jgi:hypothetical protein
LRTALACQEIFGLPVAELFAGLNDSVAKDTRSQMRKLHARIEADIDTQSPGSSIMHKFQWISHRLLEMPNFKLVSV